MPRVAYGRPFPRSTRSKKPLARCANSPRARFSEKRRSSSKYLPLPGNQNALNTGLIELMDSIRHTAWFAAFLITSCAWAQQPSGPSSGRALNLATGLPVHNATAVLFLEAEDQLSATSLTDSNGNFRF